MSGYAQTILPPATGTTLSSTIEAPSRAKVYRSHLYHNTSSVTFNGTINLEYDLNTANIPIEIGIREVAVVVTNTNTDLRPPIAAFDPTESPFLSTGWVGANVNGSSPCTTSSLTNVAELIATIPPSTANSFGNASAIQSTTVNSVCIPPGGSVYIIETIQVNSCLPNGTGYTTKLLVDFFTTPGSPPPFSYQPSGTINVENHVPVFSLTESAISSQPLRATTFLDDNCAPSTFGRELVYELKNGSLRDPWFVFALNNDTDDQITLAESELDQVKIRFELDTVDDGVFFADISTQFVTLADLQSVFANTPGLNVGYFPVDADGSGTFFTGSGASYTPPGILPEQIEFWDVNNAPNWATNGTRSTSGIFTSPSMRGTSIGEVFTKLNLSLSDLIIPAITSGSLPQLNTHAPLVAYSNAATSTQSDRDGVYLKIFEGSKIIIEYEATVVAQESIDPLYERFRSQRVELSRQVFQGNGYTECGEGAGFYRSLYPVGGAEYIEQMNILSSMSTMAGNPDHSYSTWDGDLREFTATLGELSYKQDKTKAYEFDASCSEIEFQLDFGQGLTVPCPCDLASNVSVALPSVCNTYGGVSQYVAGAPTTFMGLPGQSDWGPCSSPNPTNSPLPSSISAEDLFWIELSDGTVLSPADMDIIPEYNPTGSMIGQQWKVRFSAADFISFDGSGGSNVYQDRMDGATLHFYAKAFCPAAEPTTKYALSTYYVMGKCDGINNIVYPAGSNTGGALECSSTCHPSCPNDNYRLFLGRTSKQVSINCPGCKTPGGLVPTTITMERHPDYLGYADTNNDGFLSNPASPTVADPLTDQEIDLKRIRHGDVVTAEVLSVFYEGGAFNAVDEYSVTDLANASLQATGCNDPVNDIDLTAWIYEISSVGLTNYLVPLIKETTTSTTNHLIGEFDGTDQNRYQDLAQAYPSQIRIQIDNVPSAWIDIDPDHVVWTTGNTLRFVYDLNDILNLYSNNPDLSAAAQPVYTETILRDRIRIRFRFNFLTDVDVNANTWTSLEKTFGRELSVAHLMFVSDGDRAHWLTPTMSGNYQTTSRPGPGTDYCDIEPNIEWYCEKGEAKLMLAPYVENRYMRNLEVPTTGLKYFENFLDVPDNLSPGAEMSHQMILKTGNAEGNPNFFPNEIRYAAVPEFVELFLPEPFVPEAIFLTNGYSMSTPYYDSENTKGVRYVLHLQDQNGDLLPTMDAAGNSTGVTYPYGITVQQGVVMAESLFPHYSSTYSGLTPINGTGVLSDYQNKPIFDNSASSQIPHWRIRIPIEVFHDPAVLDPIFNNSNLISPSNSNVAYANMYLSGNTSIPQWFPGNINPTSGAFPFLVTDEVCVLTTGIIYSQPTCTAPSWLPDGSAIHADAGYPDNPSFYHERNDFWYYHGNDESVLSIFNKYHSVQVVEKDNSGIYSVSSSDYTGTEGFLHPKFETPLMMPSRIKTLDLESSTVQAARIQSDVVGVASHPLNNPAFKAEFSGAVPAFYLNTIQSSLSGYSRYNRAPNFLSDQRSNLSLLQGPTTDIQVNSSTGDFTFSFKLKDSVLKRLMPHAAPEDVELLQGGALTVTQWMANNGIVHPWSFGGNLSSRFESVKGVPTIRSIDGKPNIDLSNFYFYLRPKAIGTTLDLKTVRIKSISWNHPSAGSYSFTTSAQPNGVLACDIATNDHPRLFHIDDIIPAQQQSNGATKTISITCHFDCSDPTVQTQLTNLGTNLQLPFDILVNYNCERNKEPWKGTNKAQFTAGQNSLNGRGELTYEIAQRTRCSDDLSLNDYALEPAQLGYSVVMNETTSGNTPNCDRTFDIVFKNDANGEISPTRITLNSPIQPMTSNVGWNLVSGSTYEYIIPASLSSSLGINQSLTIPVTFGPVGCSGLNLSNLEGFADSYCSDCANCGLQRSGTINQNGSSSLLAIKTIVVTDETCANLCDGSALVSVTTTLPTLTYQLNGGPIQSFTPSVLNLSGLCAGTYTITIFAGNCCQVTQTFTVAPGLGPIPVSLVHPDCDCNGSISWTTPLPPGVQATLSARVGLSTFNPITNNTGLCSGEYRLTLTNNAGCTSTQTIFLGNAGANVSPQYISVLNATTAATLPSSSSLNDPIVVTGGVSIAPGTSLTLNNHHIIIDRNATFIVQGELNVNGTTILFSDETHELHVHPTGAVRVSALNGVQSLLSGNCDQVWTGVSNAGYFEISNSTIKDALVAIRAFGSGPQIIASETTFKNNYVGVYVSNDQEMHLDLVESTFFVDQNSGLFPFYGTPPGAPTYFRSKHHVIIEGSMLNGVLVPTSPTFCRIRENNFNFSEIGVGIYDSEGITVDFNRFEECNTGALVDANSSEIILDDNTFESEDPNEIGIHFNGTSNGMMSRNILNSNDGSIVSNYIGIKIENGSTASTCFFNRFRSVSGKNDTGIQVLQNASVNAVNNRFTAFDTGISGQDGVNMLLMDNRVSNSFVGIDLAEIASAYVNNNSIANPATLNQPTSSTTGIRLIGNVANGQVQILNNNISGTDRGIEIANNAGASIQNNVIEIANIGIRLDYPGSCEVVNNEMQTINSVGIQGIEIPEIEPVSIFENTLMNVQNGVQLMDSWFSTVSSNVLSANGIGGASGNGIDLLRSNYANGPSLSSFAVGMNQIEGFEVGILGTKSDFGNMVSNVVQSGHTGIWLSQADYGTTPLLQDNVLRENVIGLRCKRLSTSGPTAWKLALKLECNVFESTSSLAKLIDGGQWQFLNASSDPIVTSIYLQGGASSNAFRMIQVNLGAGLTHEYPSPNAMPPFGAPFYFPIINGGGNPLPTGSTAPYTNPCISAMQSPQVSVERATIDELSGIEVYPNPTNGLLTIKASSTITNLELFDSVGQKKMNIPVDEKIDIRGLPSGVYYLRIQTEEMSQMKKIVLNK